jgi:succinate-semialdehyde dehydrogenase / glutarate-semialdehyde dehydrogenase
MPEEREKPGNESAKGGAHNYVDEERPGSEFDTREMPALPDKPDDPVERKVEESSYGVVIDIARPGSSVDTVVAVREDDPGESVHHKPVSPDRPGSRDETKVFGPADDDPEGEESTAMMTRKQAFDDLETREVPSLSDDWRKRAAEVAESMGEAAEVVEAWGDEGDASLAASVAAASGEVPLPRDGEKHEVAGPVLQKARAAQAEWAKLRFEQRLPFFDALRGEMVAQRGDYVPAMATAIARPMVEALTGEYLPVLEALRTLDEIVPPMLVEQHSAGPPATHYGTTACVRMVPYGVVLIVNGINSPFAFPMTLAIDALAAGNAVVICGSENHPRVNETMRKMLRRSGLPEDLVQVIGGDAETMRVMVEAAPDKMIFEGDEDVAAKMAARCAAAGCELQIVRKAKNLMVVLASADMERAILAVLSAAFGSGGLRHGAVERVIVEDSIFDEFRMKFIDAVRTMNSHHAQLASINDAFNPRRAQMLIEDAIARGARVTYPAGEEPGRWIHWKASIVEALPPKAKLSTERFEGPGCALYRTTTPADEALNLLRILPANNISVLGQPDRELKAKLEALPAARTAFNDVMLSGTAAGGGVPLGSDTPRNLCGPHSMVRPKLMVHTEDEGRRIGWFPYTDDKAYALMDAMESMYGTQAGKRIKAAFKLVLNPTMRKLIKGEE